MIKKNNLIFFWISLLSTHMHKCTAHLEIDSTINLLEQQTKMDDEYLSAHQECSIAKQEKRRLTMELHKTRKELEAATKEKSELEQKFTQVQQTQKKADHLEQEKNEAQKNLLVLSTQTKEQKQIIQKLTEELAQVKLQQTVHEREQLNLKQELCVVYQDLEKHMKISQEHAKLQQQLAQARRDLRSPYATTVANLQSATLESGHHLFKHKNS